MESTLPSVEYRHGRSWNENAGADVRHESRMRAGCKLAQLKPQVNRSEKEEDMSQVNHSFGDGPLVLFSGLFLLATFVGELGKRQGEYKHKKQ